MSAVARRYARAAVDAAHESGGAVAVAQLAEGLERFAKLCAESVEIQQVVTNPALRHERPALLAQVGERCGLPKVAIGLIDLLASNDRFAELQEVVRHVLQIADQQVGRMRAQVTSAIEVDAAQQQRIAAALQKRFGHEVTVEVLVDPSIIAGLVCTVGDFTIDSSVKRQMEILSERLYGAPARNSNADPS